MTGPIAANVIDGRSLAADRPALRGDGRAASTSREPPSSPATGLIENGGIEELVDEINGHYLDKYGCAFGQVSSQRLLTLEGDVVELKAHIRGVNTKLWTLILLLLVQMAGTIVYLVTRA